MVQGGDGVRLALESFGEAILRTLYSDHALQARVARFVDFAHTARADGRKDFVGTKMGSWSQGHKGVDRFYPAGGADY
jgi:hypothetical protein